MKALMNIKMMEVITYKKKKNADPQKVMRKKKFQDLKARKEKLFRTKVMRKWLTKMLLCLMRH